MNEIGYCESHNRIYEGLCKTCEVIVCASCVLFGSHQKHDILSLKEGAMYLRENIDSQIKKGNLKKEFTESHLLEIREYHLRLEKYQNETVKKIDDIFKEIINSLKKRKTNLITDLLEKFKCERENILENENNWVDKQEISEKLIILSKDSDDINLLFHSKFVMEGIRKINERLQFKEIKVFNDVDPSLQIDRKGGSHHQQVILSQEEIVHYLSKYVTIREPNILEYKA